MGELLSHVKRWRQLILAGAPGSCEEELAAFAEVGQRLLYWQDRLDPDLLAMGATGPHRYGAEVLIQLMRCNRFLRHRGRFKEALRVASEARWPGLFSKAVEDAAPSATTVQQNLRG